MEQILKNRQEQVQRALRVSVYVLLLLIFVLTGGIIVAYDALIPSSSKLALTEGQAAPRDVLAPRSLQFESDVLLREKQEEEIGAVRPIYDPPDTSIAREQSHLARQILDYIENVRFDDFATVQQQREDISAITDLSLSPQVVDTLLNISDDEEWREIDLQIVRLLERVMGGEVREDTIQSIRDNLPNQISASYSESEVQVIQAIVSDLIRVNSFYNEELTRQEQERVAEDVPIEMRTFVEGQVIIREGEIANEAHIEALDRFGLLRVEERKAAQFAGGLLGMVLITTLLGVYIRMYHPGVFLDPRFMILLGVLFLVFLAGARIVSGDDSAQYYFYPSAALAFLVTTLVSPQLAIVMTISLATLAGFMSGDSFEFTILAGTSGILGILALGRTEGLTSYFRAGIAVGLVSIGVAAFFALGAETSVDFFVIATKIAGSVVNGLLSAAVALAGLYVIGNLLNIPTSLKIFELLQPNHPLLQELLRKAPGTYQHSLQVANLAERGALEIGADAALVRAAAMYHDVGKMSRAHFFVENQVDGRNPHDKLNDPYQSAQIIINHVVEGERIARRYRLPARLRDFILEHHGTTQVKYFHNQALEHTEHTGETVDIAQFTYPGPRPRSRETAILMLADGCESSVRARRPEDKTQIQETVDFIFETRLQERQLDDSGLTLSDLRVLRDTFLSALHAVFHPRIAYPGAPSRVEEGDEKPSQLPPGEEQDADAVIADKTAAPDEAAATDEETQADIQAGDEDDGTTEDQPGVEAEAEAIVPEPDVKESSAEGEKPEDLAAVPLDNVKAAQAGDGGEPVQDAEADAGIDGAEDSSGPDEDTDKDTVTAPKTGRASETSATVKPETDDQPAAEPEPDTDDIQP
ncbi:MAG: HDIG domain-containing protein [Chloroflexi bacterium]|nr:HDIG domain-containing protein [Chloroflexota bacterium]